MLNLMNKVTQSWAKNNWSIIHCLHCSSFFFDFVIIQQQSASVLIFVSCSVVSTQLWNTPISSHISAALSSVNNPLYLNTVNYDLRVLILTQPLNTAADSFPTNSKDHGMTPTTCVAAVFLIKTQFLLDKSQFQVLTFNFSTLNQLFCCSNVLVEQILKLCNNDVIYQI